MKEVDFILVQDVIFGIFDNLSDLHLIYYCLEPIWNSGSNARPGESKQARKAQSCDSITYMKLSLTDPLTVTAWRCYLT